MCRVFTSELFIFLRSATKQIIISHASHNLSLIFLHFVHISMGQIVNRFIFFNWKSTTFNFFHWKSKFVFSQITLPPTPWVLNGRPLMKDSIKIKHVFLLLGLLLNNYLSFTFSLNCRSTVIVLLTSLWHVSWVRTHPVVVVGDSGVGGRAGWWAVTVGHPWCDSVQRCVNNQWTTRVTLVIYINIISCIIIFTNKLKKTALACSW